MLPITEESQHLCLIPGIVLDICTQFVFIFDSESRDSGNGI